MTEQNLNCNECKKCNRKGKPSGVMKGSAICDLRRGREARIGLFDRLRFRMSDLGKMRRRWF